MYKILRDYFAVQAAILIFYTLLSSHSWGIFTLVFLAPAALVSMLISLGFGRLTKLQPETLFPWTIGLLLNVVYAIIAWEITDVSIKFFHLA